MAPLTIYAIDFGSQAAGKRIATTKRRVRWRWGFANPEALSQGLTGTDCRGEEHDVTLVWSLTSGKRQITMDGQEVHYSSSRSGTIDFSWTMKGNHILKLVAHSTPPLNASPNFRPYDFFVDGQSFFRLPKVFELGVKGTPQAQARSFGAPYPDDIQAAEDVDLQRAIQESLVEAENYMKKKEAPRSIEQPGVHAITSSGTNLLDFGADPPPTNYGPPPVQYVQAPAPYGQPPASYGQPPPSYASAPPVPSNHHAPVYNYSPVPALPPTSPSAYDPSNSLALVPAQPQPPVYNSNPPVYAPSYPPPPVSYESNPPVYAPKQPASYAPSTPNSVAAPPNYQNYASGELFSPGVTSTASAPPPYGFPGQQPMHNSDDPFAPKVPTQNELLTSVLGLYGQAPSTPSTPGAPPQPNFQSPVAPPSGSSVNSSGNFGNTNLSMNAPLSVVNDEEDVPKSAFDKALNSLVNFDDISAPADRDIEKARQKKLEEQKVKGNKSKALPPVANSLVGSGATLTQISQVKTTSALKDPSAVMKPPPHMFHQDASMAGALVIRGDGPPPLQPQGFGVVHGQGYYGSRAGY